MDTPVMILYIFVVYDPKMCMKSNICLHTIKGDNSREIIMCARLVCDFTHSSN